MMKISFILWQVIWVFEYRWKVWTFLSLVSCSHKDIIYDFHCFLFSGIKGGSSALAKHCVLANFSILCTSFHEITKSSGLQNGRAPERHQCVRTNHLSIEGAPGDRQGLWLSTHITDGHLVCNQNHIQAVFFTASFYFLSDLTDPPHPSKCDKTILWSFTANFSRVPVLSCLGAQGRTTPPSPPPLKCDKTLYTGL